MNRSMFVASMIVLALSQINAHASDKVLRIATEGASPPWDSIDANGQLVGYDIDVGNELCRRMKVECTFVAQDWDGIIPALTIGKFDAIMSGMSITTKRKESIAFTEP